MNDADIRKVFESAVPQWVNVGERILLVVPDTTRTAPMAQILGLLLPVLKESGCSITVLVALGTHPPLNPEVLEKHLGMPLDGDVKVLNHAWNDPDAVMSVGKLSAEEVKELSGGLMEEDVDLRVNKAVAEHDRMIFLHPVFPHEMVGFSGGSKYLFPGISGPEMIDIVHWLGALCYTGNVIGKIDTPSRTVLDGAAEKMPLPMHGFSFVYHKEEIVTMESGEMREAWRKAAEVSQNVHVTYTGRKYSKLLACCPSMYPDLWTGGKCVYKCEPVVEDGGELIVYAPHVKMFSEVHQETVLAIGYHTRDYFLADMDKFSAWSRAIMAYSTIVKGEGTYIDGVEKARINVSFATQIPRDVCENAGIGYIDPATIDPAKWIGREDEGILCVEHAGEMLYREMRDT